MNAVTKHYDYCWEVRERSLKSCVGYFTLLTGVVNYAFSIAFIAKYVDYSDAVEQNKLDTIKCEIVSSFAIVSYCSLFQVTLGSITCLIYISSFCVKACHSSLFLCPVLTTGVKKRIKGIPREFDFYGNANDGQGEFDFDCSDEEIEVASIATVKVLQQSKKSKELIVSLGGEER